MLHIKNSVTKIKHIQQLYSVLTGLFSLLFLTLFLCSGCSTISRKKVEFINPYTILPVTRVAPSDAESKGVVLRLKLQATPIVYKDIVQLYSQIEEDDSAIPLDATKIRELSFKEGSDANSFILSTKTTAVGSELQGGVEELELDNRGTILKFIRGDFTTKYGDMTFLSHKRSAIFPSDPVAVGDKWEYTEEVDIELDSTLVSRKNEKPDEIKVECKLDGFALFDGVRCAVISTKAITRSMEHISSFWNDMDLDVNVYADEIIYFDYNRGLVLGRITKTDSYSTSKKTDFSDISRSQTITIIEKNQKKIKNTLD